MIKGLQAARKEDILALGYAIAGRVYQSEDDHQWLKRRFEMLGSMFEDSWSYREIVQKGIDQGLEKGLEKGLAKGLEKGREEGGLEALRPLLVRVVETRFPELVSLAQQQVQQITTPAQLSALIDELLVAQTTEKAHQVLTGGGSPSNSPS